MKSIYFILILCLVIILSFLLLIPSYSMSKEKKKGNISRITYLAPFDFKVIDKEKTQERIKDNQSRILNVYAISIDGSLKLLDHISRIFSKIDNIREDNKISQIKKVEKIKRLLPEALSQDAKFIAQADRNTFIELEETTKGIMNICLDKGILEEEVPYEKIEVIKSKEKHGSITNTKDILTIKRIKSSNLEQLKLISRKITPIDKLSFRIASSYLTPNLYFDKNTTKKRKESVNKEPIEVFVKRGDVIVKEGEVIDALCYEKFKTIAKMKMGINKETFSFTLFIFLSFLALTVAFILKYQNELRKEKVLAISFVCLSIILLSKCLTLNPSFWMCLPMASISILTTIFSDPSLSIFLTFILSILISQSLGLELSGLIFFLIPSLSSIFFLSIARKRTDLVKVCLGIAICNILLSLFVPHNDLRQKLSFSLLNGLFVYLITIVSLFIFELFFSTNFKLLELSDLNISLLRDLFLEAPGTYHHSLIVGTLAEDASLSIGANPCLARAGSYYHDIGKMINPEYFIENQKENKALLSPPILMSHIERGISIAKIKHLPGEIINIIRSHHGTSTIGEERYPGPQPETKEEAIIMLADAVEERIRNFEKPSPEIINKLVCEVINGKLSTGQLSSSSLTMKEIKKIKESFINVLSSLFHAKDEAKDFN